MRGKRDIIRGGCSREAEGWEEEEGDPIAWCWPGNSGGASGAHKQEAISSSRPCVCVCVCVLY